MNKKGHPVHEDSAIDLTPTALKVEIERSAKHEGVLPVQTAPNQADRPLEPAVNFPDLLRRVGNDRELVRELFEIFKEEFPHLLRSLKESARCADMKHVETTSHTLKGMLSSFSAKRAAAAAAHLEKIGRDEIRPEIREAIESFEYEATTLLSELDAYLAGAQP